MMTKFTDAYVRHQAILRYQVRFYATNPSQVAIYRYS